MPYIPQIRNDEQGNDPDGHCDQTKEWGIRAHILIVI